MKKTVFALITTTLLLSCSSNDTYYDPPANGGNDAEPTDSQIVGKWRVAYSKEISPAIYISNLQELDEAKTTFANGENFRIGINMLNENPKVTEYFGNYGEPDVVPKTGMFDFNEVWIEIKKDRSIDVYRNRPESNLYPILKVSFTNENNRIIWDEGIKKTIRYYFEDSTLVMELVKIETHSSIFRYIISKYIKIE